MVDKGDVFYCPSFIVEDGILHDTWFLILSGGTPWLPLICIKGTTKTDRFQPLSGIGCYNSKEYRYKSFYIPANSKECFPRNTCLPLNQIYVIPFNKFLSLRKTNKLQHKCSVSQNCLYSVLKCVSTQEDDVPVDAMKRIRKTINDMETY